MRTDAGRSSGGAVRARLAWVSAGVQRGLYRLAGYRRRVLGLSISAERVEAVVLRGGAGGVVVEQVEQVEVGAALDVDAIVAAVREVMGRIRHRPGQIVAGIRSEDTLVRSFTMPKIPRREWDSAVRFEATKYIPFRLDDVLVDFLVLPDKGRETMSVIFVGVKRESVDRLKRLLARADVFPDVIEPAPLGLLRGLAAVCPPQSDPMAVIHVLPQTAIISIVRGGLPFLVRDLAFAQGPREARRVEAGEESPGSGPLARGPAPAAPGAEAGEEGSEKVLRNLLGEIRLSIGYFEQSPAGQSVQRIVVCGVASVVEPLAGRLQEGTGLAVDIVDPLAALTGGRGGGRAFTLATGLALRGLAPSPVRLALREPGQAAPGRVDLPFSPLPFAVGGIAAICLVCWWGTLSARLRQAEGDVAALREHTPVSDLISSRVTLGELKELHQRLGAAAGYGAVALGGAFQWSGVLQGITRIVPEEGWLTSLAVRGGIPYPAGSTPRSLHLAGYLHRELPGDVEGALQAITYRLRDDRSFGGRFLTAELKDIGTARVGELEVNRFSIVADAPWERP